MNQPQQPMYWDGRQWVPQQPPPQQPPPQQPPPQQPPPQQAPQHAPPQQQWAPQQPPHWTGHPEQPGVWPGQYAPPPGPSIGTHIKRAFDWNVAEIAPTPREAEQLNTVGIEPRLQGLFVWRRSTLLVALPVMVLSVVLNFVQAGQNETRDYTGFGKLLNYLPSIALVFIPLGSIAVIRSWREMRRSSKTLVVCWVISIAVPLFVALMPLEFVLDLDKVKQEYINTYGSLDGFDAGVFGSRLLQAIKFALVLLPVVLSVPGGVLKGAGRIKSLFPSASLPGWFLVAVAPFYSMFMIVVFVLIDQVVGNGLLLIGVGILAFTPWLFVIYRSVYGRPLSMEESRTELARASRWGGWLTLLGLAFVVIFMFTAQVAHTDVMGSDGKKAIFSYVQVLRTVGEVLSRGLVTAVVFSTIFLYLVYAEWRTMREMSGAIRREHDEQILALQHYMATPGAMQPPAWSLPAPPPPR